MFKFFAKPFRLAVLFSLALAAATGYVVADTFFIPRAMEEVSSPAVTVSAPVPVEKVVTDHSYVDENIRINIETTRVSDTTVYLADVTIKSASLLKTAFANNVYGRNIIKKPSAMAAANNAILAINGDFYGYRNTGYVLRNGVVYRTVAGVADDLVIDKHGDFSIISEKTTSLAAMDTSQISQILSFGPALVQDWKIQVATNFEVQESMKSNPRTAIGQISPLHYLIVVSDGRTKESAGLSVYQVASILQEKGCSVGYNLDGGGSSALIFNGKLINKPINGNTVLEREVSDIVYFGY